MPTYHIEMMEGRTVEQKKKLVQEITRITVDRAAQLIHCSAAEHGGATSNMNRVRRF